MSDTPILYYEIWSRRVGHSWQGPVNATTEMANIQRSLSPSASYGVQVRAVSAIGAGPYSREEILESLFQNLHIAYFLGCVYKIACITR